MINQFEGATLSHVKSLKLRDFTVFEDVDIQFASGLNVLIGANGTGKTHVMKLIYSLISYPHYRNNLSPEDKILGVFLPDEHRLGRLVRRRRGVHSAEVALRGEGMISTMLKWSTRSVDRADVSRGRHLTIRPRKSYAIYIPVKEFLTHSKGFQSLYRTDQIFFEETYDDLLTLAFLPKKRGVPDDRRKLLLTELRKEMHGTVVLRDESFYLKTPGEGLIEFSLVAEGWRKLGLIWTLIQNGSLTSGSFLFWDEPEANLNPSIQRCVAKVLVELQRIGVQVFVATHDYFFLKELDLARDKSDKVRYHLMSRKNSKDPVACKSFESYLDAQPNPINDTLDRIYDDSIRKTLEIKG